MVNKPNPYSIQKLQLSDRLDHIEIRLGYYIIKKNRDCWENGFGGNTPILRLSRILKSFLKKHIKKDGFENAAFSRSKERKLWTLKNGLNNKRHFSFPFK